MLLVFLIITTWTTHNPYSKQSEKGFPGFRIRLHREWEEFSFFLRLEKDLGNTTPYVTVLSF